jgi:phytoene desaturase
MSKKVIIIGSGVAGLASAVRMAKAGCAVTVFEANPFPGGKINSKWLGKYRFDMGPSVFTGPNYLKELFDLCGKDFSAFPFEKMDTSFHYFLAQGKRFRLSADRGEQVSTIERELGEEGETYVRYMNRSKEMYKRIAPLFIEGSLHHWPDLMNRKLVKALAYLPKYSLQKTMHQVNSTTFKNPLTHQIFNRFATYNGSSPYKAPAMLNMIAHLELNEGVYLPKNGMIQITDALYQLAVEQGVEFRFSEKVNRITVANGKVTGVETSQGNYTADGVISNMDVAFTYEKLLPEAKHPKKILAQEKSSSAIVFYLGIKNEFIELGLHNIFFTKDYPAEFKAIFEDKVVYDDPTIYINITSKHVAGDAPIGSENWFVMINAPADSQKNWEVEIPRIRKIILAKLSDELGVDVEALIEEEDVMHPGIIEQRYSGKMGSIYGNASNNKFAAFYRHANFSKDIKGLYFAGVTVHPGGGIPLALNSAKLATRFALRAMQ